MTTAVVAQRSMTATLVLAPVTFLFVFGWKITPAADLILLVSAVLSFVAFVMLDAPLDRRLLGLIWPMAALAAIALLHAALQGGSDSQLALRSIRTVVNTLGGAALCMLYARCFGERWIARLCAHLFWCIVAHALLVVLMYVVPSLRNAIYAMADTARYVNDSASFKLGFRVPGLTYGLSQTSVLHFFGVLLAALAWRDTRSVVMRTAILAGTLLVLFSMFLIGRSGLFIGLLVLMPAVVAMRLGAVRKVRRPWRRGRALVPLFVIGAVVAAGATVAIRQLPEHFLSYNLVRAGEVLLAFTDPGESGTVRAVQAMYILPRDPWTLLVGEGGMGRDAFQYVSSDVGYVRVLWASGLLGSLLLLAPFVAGLCFAVAARHADRLLCVVTCTMLTATLLLHFKEIAVLTRNQWSVQALLICCALAMTHRVVRPTRRAGVGEMCPAHAGGSA